MAFKAVVASGLVLAGAEHVKLTYSDCGSSSTHAKVTGLKPDAIDVPGKAAIIGSGTLDSDQTSAHFNLKVTKAGIPFFSGKGNICEDTSFKLPLGTGSFTVKGLDCPLSAGNINVEVDLDILSEFFEDGENSLLSIHIDASADDTGDQVLCLDVDASLATEITEQWAGMCCYGPGQCKSSKHCDFTCSSCGGCGVGGGRCMDGESCLSARFQSEEFCPSYCEWVVQPVPGTEGIGECVPAGAPSFMDVAV
jgi:hypothetical protein